MSTITRIPIETEVMSRGEILAHSLAKSSPSTDTLIQIQGQNYLAITGFERYNNLKKLTEINDKKFYQDFSKKQKEPLEAALVRNHPAEYAGKTFFTGKSIYSIDQDLAFHGRPSIEGAQINKIAGIDPEYKMEISMYLGSKNYGQLNELIDLKGEEAKEGLLLVLTLTSDEMIKRSRIGFVSSEIQRIQ